MRSWLLVPLLALPLAAQAPRTVRHLDGHPDEAVRVQGRGFFVRDEGRFVEGLAALRVEPEEGKTWFGINLHDLPVRSPKRLLLHAFNATEKPFPLRVNVYDAAAKGRRDQAAWKEATCRPGWTEVSVDLTTLKSYADQRELDIAEKVERLEISARRDDVQGEASLILDDVRFVGEEGGRHALRLLREGLSSDDGKARARAVRDHLPFLAEPDRLRFALELLEKEEHPWLRKVARDVLAELAHEASAKDLVKAITRARGPRRVELLAALASMASPVARADALKVAADGRRADEQACIVRHLARRGHATDLLPLIESIPARGPWQPRAALVEALARTACPAGVDGLIAMLGQKNEARIQEDLVDTLAALTGKDIGADARAWKSWWDANRETAEIAVDPEPYRREGYSFFGIPVRRGRVLFIIDSSGSMDRPVVGGKGAEWLVTAPHLKDVKITSRFDLAREELLHALRGLEEGHSAAGIILVNDEAYWVTKDLEKVTRSSREKMEKKVRTFKARFKGNFQAAFEAVFQPEKVATKKDLQDGPDTIFFLSDGRPSAGEVQDERDLRDAINTWNLGRMIRIHAVNVGSGGSRLLRGISGASGGRFVDLSSEREPPRRTEKKDAPR